MPQLIVHIGLPKTATTTLQTDVFPSMDPGVIEYVGVRQPRSASQDELYERIYRAARSGHTIDAVADEIQRRLDCGRHVLLSEELLTVTDSTVTWRTKLGNLAELIGRFEYRVLVTVRDPVDAMFSFYVERHERFQDSAAPLEELAATDDRLCIYRYEELFGELSQLFEGDRLHVLTFEDIIHSRFDRLVGSLPRGAISDSQSIAIDNRNARSKKSDRVATGESITLRSIARRAARAWGIQQSSTYRRIRRHLDGVVRGLDRISIGEKSVQRLTAEQRRTMRLTLEPDTEWLFASYGIDYRRRSS